jgi:hypothetical protein
MTTVLVVGCSITKGQGLAKENLDPRLWANQLFEGCDVTNLSKSGANNEWIFLETISALIRKSYDIVLVAWSAIPRYNFQVGLELYTVDTMLTNLPVSVNNQITYSGTWLEKVGNNLRRLHNDHWDILKMIKYVNVLQELQIVSRGKQLFFVNGIGPWCANYFEPKQIQLPSDLDQYEQDLLQVETRDDTEIFQLYQMIHQHYRDYGGIQEPLWLNLYKSLAIMQVDYASNQDHHPGYQSQDLFVSTLRPVLQNKLK